MHTVLTIFTILICCCSYIGGIIGTYYLVRWIDFRFPTSKSRRRTRDDYLLFSAFWPASWLGVIFFVIITVIIATPIAVVQALVEPFLDDVDRKFSNKDKK